MCGEAGNAWVPTLGASAWSGTVGTDSLTATFTTVLAAAAAVIGGIPAVGTWAKDSTGFHFTAALEGYIWRFSVTAEGCNANGDVTSAVGSAIDGLDNTHAVAMTRTL